MLATHSLGPCFVLSVAVATGCGGVQGEPPGNSSTSTHVDSGVTRRPPDSGPPRDSGRDAAGDAGNVFFSGKVQTDGPIVTDGVNLYWTESSNGPGDALVWCPLSGCATASVLTETAVGGGPFWDEPIGALAVGGGRIYFQRITDRAVVSCPTTGCGAGPDEFAPVAGGGIGAPNFNASLAADGANLYWTDIDTIYACPLGPACATPVTLASFTASVEDLETVGQLFPSGPTLYWADNVANEVYAVPVTGGPKSTVCSVPGSGAVAFANQVAVLGGDVYTAAPLGIYQCPLAGGSAALYVPAAGASDLLTDGTGLFWEDENNFLTSCVPGVSCTSPTELLAVPTYGFALAGNDVYALHWSIWRVPN